MYASPTARTTERRIVPRQPRTTLEVDDGIVRIGRRITHVEQLLERRRNVTGDARSADTGGR
jgi:hypothetical protein